VWTQDVYEQGALSPVLAVPVIAVALIALVVLIVLALVRARKRDALAATAEASVGDVPPALVENSDVILFGVVRHAPDQHVAVKVAITQEGKETESSGTWSHSWTEIDRDITVVPFLLELPNKTHVLVEPPQNVDVADALDQKVWIDRNRRILSAELVPGEAIYARGRLERSEHASVPAGYRDVQWGWALRGSRHQMLLSSEPLGSGLRARAAFHRRCAWIALVVLIATQVTLAGFYRRALGHTEVVTVTKVYGYETTNSDGDVQHHDALTFSGGGEDINSRDADRVHAGDTIPLRVAANGDRQLGAYPTIYWIHALCVALASLICWSWYRARRQRSRPWFRRKLNESGTGPLPDSH
jgi:hypothetical protein